MTVLAALKGAVDDLDSLGVRSALVGGLAVSARAEPRFTRDADLVVAVGSSQAAELLAFEMRRLGYTIDALVEHQMFDRLLTIRLRSRVDPSVLIDLLTASSGIEPEVIASADVLEIAPRLRLAVASTGHLIALKLLSTSPDRGQDDLDLAALADVASDDDWLVATEACELIAQRGFNRGRDLASSLRDRRARARRSS